MSDVWEDPDVKDWMDNVREELVPKMRDSKVIASIVPENPDDTDIKFAVELGLAIMLDKPIIAVVRPGTKVPERLVLAADHILEGDLSNPENLSKRLMQVMKEMQDNEG